MKKIIPWNKGLKGVQVAWNKGLTKDTDERVAKYSESISEYLKENKRIPWNKEMKGDPNYPLKGIKRDKTLVKRLVKTRMENGYKHSEETKRKIGEKSKQKVMSLEARKKISKACKGRIVSEETKKKMSDFRKTFKYSLESKKKMSDSQRKFNSVRTKETKKKISSSMKKKWLNKEYQENWATGCEMSPNKFEMKIDNMLQEMFPGEWKFVGDGHTFIVGKNPDFLNVNGQKKLIECFGDYWHKKEDEKERKDHFKKYGFDTLFIWEHELKSEKRIKNKIEKFYNR